MDRESVERVAWVKGRKFNLMDPDVRSEVQYRTLSCHALPALLQRRILYCMYLPPSPAQPCPSFLGPWDLGTFGYLPKPWLPRIAEPVVPTPMPTP